jgi:hypothetical protein
MSRTGEGAPLAGPALKGKTYFRSNGGERELPDIVLDLRGSLRVILVGFIDSVQKKGSSRVRTRFLDLPDAPVSSVQINFFGGKRGLIENSRDLCKTKPRVEIRLKAQNGRSQITKPRIDLPC